MPQAPNEANQTVKGALVICVVEGTYLFQGSVEAESIATEVFDNFFIIMHG